MKFLWLLSVHRKWHKPNVHWKPNKEKETKQIVVYWEKLVIEIFLVKGFSVQKKWEKTISSALSERLLKADKNQWIIKPKGLLIYNPIKQLFAKLKQ